MTEKDLIRYKHAVLEEQRRRSILMANETLMNAPRSPLSPTPPDHWGDGTVKLAADLDRLNRLRARVKEAIDEVSLAEIILEAARRTLDEKEQAVFDLLYFGYVNGRGERSFCSIREAAKKLHYAPSSIYAIRKRILTKIAPISV